MCKPLWFGLILAAALPFAAPPAAAQEPDVLLRFSPFVGALRPARSLGPDFRIRTVALLGLNLEAILPAPLSLRATFAVTDRSTMPVAIFCVAGSTTIVGPCPQPEVNARMLLANADVVYRALRGTRNLTPYLVAGGGIKQYRFVGTGGFVPGSFSSDVIDPAAHLGAGVEIRVGRALGAVELGDYLSRFHFHDGVDQVTTQHDLVFRAGVSFDVH